MRNLHPVTAPGRVGITAVALAVALAAGCGGGTDPLSSGDTVATTASLDTAPATTAPATTAPVPTAPATVRGMLAIQTSGVHLVDLATGEVTALAPDLGDGAEHPDWSPDGASVVFHVDFTSLWIADVASGSVEQLFECVAPCGAIQDPAWSPDGSEVAFSVAETDGVHTTRAAIEAIDVDTGALRTVYEDLSGTVWTVGPRWSPDGESVVFEETTWASNSWTEETVATVAVATVVDGGTAASRIVQWDGPLAGPGSPAPDWSPAGDLIVYSRDDDLVTVRPDGTGATPITDLDGVTEHAIQPAFAPDGTGIVFTYVRGEFGVDDVPSAAIVDLDGSNLTVLSERATHPKLRP